MASQQKLRHLLFFEMLPVILQLILIMFAIRLSHSQDLVFTFLTTIICIIWVKSSENPIPQKVMEARVFRRIFLVLAEDGKKDSVEEEFDKAMDEELLLGSRVDSDDMKTSIKSGQIVNVVRDVFVIGLYLYLLYLFVTAS